MRKIGNLFFIFFSTIIISSCYMKASQNTSVRAHAIRLKPGEDLMKSLKEFAAKQEIKAGWVSTAVGSLTRYNLRMANQSTPDAGVGHFEIVSLSGTFSESGPHLHIAISDSTGKTIGGHLLEGCTIYTTAEVVLLSTSDFRFVREKDGTTPYEELQIVQPQK